MTNREIQFWRKQRDQHLLINALRADPKRAINFFGACAVFSEFELELHRIIESYAIVNTDVHDLLEEMNGPLNSLLADPRTSPTPDFREFLEQRVKFELGDMTNMKKRAQDHLRRLFA
jgi:hypothetical protein